MREIKFRAWNPDDIKMEYPLVLAMCNDRKMKPLIKCSDGNNAYKDYHLMQYTGLKDKNGIDIYEGDMVQHDAWNYPFKVIFNQEKARFVCKMKTGITQYIDNKRLQVIGNVYQSPELINQNKNDK